MFAASCKNTQHTFSLMTQPHALHLPHVYRGQKLGVTVPKRHTRLEVTSPWNRFTSLYDITKGLFLDLHIVSIHFFWKALHILEQ